MKVIITDHFHPALSKGLTDMGWSVDEMPDISNEELFTCLNQYDGIVLSTKTKMDATMINAGPGLRFIGRVGSGLDHIDTELAAKLGIEVLSSPEGNANAVAEHALGMLLNLIRNQFKANAEVHNGQWLREVNRGRELSSLTVGLIGFGNTGSRFGKKLQSLGTRVLVFDKYKTGFGGDAIIETDLEQVRAEADVISFHVPHTAETNYYLNRSFLEGCKDGVTIINTSRGKVVNTYDLIDGLESGKVRCAALDVFENESWTNLSDEEKNSWNRLMELPEKVLLTPHIAGWTRESKLKLVEVLLEKLRTLYPQGLQKD